MKRGRLKSLFLALGLLLSLQLSVAHGAERKPAFIPLLGHAEMVKEFQPLMGYMTNSTGNKVTLHIAESYGDLRDQMEAGAIRLGTSGSVAIIKQINHP